MEMHSTVTIVFNGLILCTTLACFSTLYRPTMVPILVENSYILVCLIF